MILLNEGTDEATLLIDGTETPESVIYAAYQHGAFCYATKDIIDHFHIMQLGRKHVEHLTAREITALLCRNQRRS